MRYIFLLDYVDVVTRRKYSAGHVFDEVEFPSLVNLSCVSPYSEDPDVDGDSDSYYCVNIGREVKGGCYVVICKGEGMCPYV